VTRSTKRKRSDVPRAPGRSQGLRRIPFGPGARQDNELSNKLYVGNIAFSSTEAELRELFGRHGAVESVAVVTDRQTGQSRGFAFVEMEDGHGAQEAIRALDGTDLGGRTIKVNEAKDRGPRRF
jgi:RNA recognition motif-containing protein